MTDMEPEQHPNLKPFKKGEAPESPAKFVSGHPQGRRSVLQSLNDLLMVHPNGDAAYSVEALEKIVSDPNQPPARILAARRVLSACRDGTRYVKDKHGNVFPAGSDPEPGRDFDRIVDRLEGKPTVRIEHEDGPRRTESEVKTELLRLVAKHPELMSIMQNRILEDGNTRPDDEDDCSPEP